MSIEGEVRSQGSINTDKEIWRKVKDDYYSPSIHITKDGEGVGINVGGSIVVMPIEKWHELALKLTNLPLKEIDYYECKGCKHRISKEEHDLAKFDYRCNGKILNKQCDWNLSDYKVVYKDAICSIMYPKKKGLLPNPKSYADEMFNREIEQYNSAISDMRKLNGEGGV